MKARLVKAIVLAVLIAGGFLYYRSALRPDVSRLEDFAEAALRDIFGPDVTHGPVEVNFLEGVRISHLRVMAPGANELALWADLVEIQHDVLAMSAGVMRLRSVTVRGAVIAMHEAPDGDVDFDFPFHVPTETSTAGRPPDLRVERGEIRLRAAANSKNFRPGYRLVLGDVHLLAKPDLNGVLRIGGGFVPKDLGLERKDWEITLKGSAQPSVGQLEIELTWDPLTVTPEIRAALSGRLLADLDSLHSELGPKHRLSLGVARDPSVEEGRVQWQARFHAEIGSLRDFPGVKTIDTETREQLSELFGKIQLDVVLAGDRVDIQSVAGSLGGGRVRAHGFFEEDGKVLHLEIEATGVQVDDPAIRKALGKTGEQVFSEFDLRGRMDAGFRIDKERDGEVTWEADVFLQDVSVAFRGPPDAVRKKPSGAPVMDGFPYAMEHAFGEISIRSGEVVVHGIEGRHGAATVRVRGDSERSASGGETGFIRWGDKGTDMRVTIEALNVPVDADFLAAADASEIYDMVDKFRVGGVIDRILVDFFQDPARDEKGLVEVSAELKGDTFTYSGFPLPVADVSGSIKLLRPPRGERTRGREFHIEAQGLAAEGRVTIEGHVLESENRGRWHVTGTNLRLEGELVHVAAKAVTSAGSVGSITEFLEPVGRVDFVADFPEYADPGPASYRVDIRNAEMRLGRYGPTPGPMLTDVKGTVVSSGTRVELSGVTALLEGSPIRIDGHVEGGVSGAWAAHVAGEGLRVTEGLLAAADSVSGGKGILPPGVALHPGGRVDLDARLEKAAGLDARTRVALHAQRADLTVKIGMLPVRVRGAFHVDGDDVRLENLTAEGSGIEIRVPSARLGAHGLEGAVTARLTDVTTSAEVLGLLPESIRGTLGDLTRDRLLQAVDLNITIDGAGETRLEGRLGLKARPDAPSGGAPRGEVKFAPIVISAPDANGARVLRGSLEFLGLALDVGPGIEDARGIVEVPDLVLLDRPSGTAIVRDLSGRVAGLAVEGVSTRLAWRDGILEVSAIEGSFYGGRLTGEVKLHTRAPTAYEGRVSVDGASLESLHNDLGPGGPDFKGQASLDATFQSRSGSVRDLTAAGCLRVRCGDLGDLPPFASVPALLAALLHTKTKPKFEKADVSFWIDKEVVHVDPLVLWGPLYRAKGRGTLDFSGWLDLDLSPEFLKNLLLPGVLTVPVLGDVVGFFSESVLYVVRIRGELKNPKTTLVPLPFLSPSRGTPPFQGTDFLGKPTRKIPSWFR